jgi:TolB-like protein/predicted Zn-dependent protease
MDQTRTLLQARLLGGFELRSGHGRDTAPTGRKVRALLACLVLSPGKAWPREKLMALLWSDRGEEQARASLRQALAELRRAFGEPSPLRAEHDAVSLDPAMISVDAVAFEGLAKAGRLDEAAALYRGPLLDGHGVRDDAFEEWLGVERGRLHDLAVELLDQLAMSQSGDAAIKTAQRLLQLDPAREETHRLLMRLYAAAGQRAQALRQYQQCRDTLQRELQAQPDIETERLYRQIQDEPLPAEVTSAGAARSDPPDSKPSIAVLPFTNMSGDAEQEYFSDGITEDIITELSRFSEILVTARDSSLAVKGKNLGIREIAAQLGVNYVVEGGVRKAGSRVRVTAQLIDAETMNHTWAERYDRDLADVFDLQDEVARTIAITVAGRVKAAGADRARRKPTAHLSAYDNYLRAREHFRSYDRFQRAEPFLLKAIEIDPGFALALAHLSVVNVVKYFFDGEKSHLDDAESWGRRAIALDDSMAWCQLAVGHPLIFQGRLEDAGPYLERAVAFNSNDTLIRNVYAHWLSRIGRSDEALAEMAAVFRRDPMPIDPHWDVLAMAQTAAGYHAEAIASYKRMVEIPYWAYAYLTICHIGLDQLPEARAAAARFTAEGPQGTVATFLQGEPYRDPAVVARFRSALLAAGVPEGEHDN